MEQGGKTVEALHVSGVVQTVVPDLQPNGEEQTDEQARHKAAGNYQRLSG
jgi:hypothetical protein